MDRAHSRVERGVSVLDDQADEESKPAADLPPGVELWAPGDDQSRRSDPYIVRSELPPPAMPAPETQRSAVPPGEPLSQLPPPIWPPPTFPAESLSDTSSSVSEERRQVESFVCPRCGASADADSRFCRTCGLELASQYHLPTGGEWLSRHGDAASTSKPSSLWAATGTNRTTRAPTRAPDPTRAAHAGTRGEADPPAPRLLLGWAAATFGVGALFATVASLLLLVEALQQHALTGVSAAQSVDLVSNAVFAVALAVATTAFVGAPASRARRLGSGALVACLAFVLEVVSNGITTGVDAAHHVDGKIIAATAIQGTSELAAAAAAVVVASTFLHFPPQRRDGGLGWANIVLGFAFVVAMVSTILFDIAYSDVGFSGGFTSGLGLSASGQGIAIFAAGSGATVFLMAAHRQAHNGRGRNQRDRRLAVATGVFAVAFVLITIGQMVAAGSVSTSGVNGEFIASLWLGGAQYLAYTTSAVVASFGLILSRGAVIARYGSAGL
jgi:hypothetical protein